jgi:hypothetical protein
LDLLARARSDYTCGPEERSMARVPAVSPHDAEPEVARVYAAATIAWESYRARFNHALGIPAQGFAGSGYCVRPTAPP